MSVRPRAAFRARGRHGRTRRRRFAILAGWVFLSAACGSSSALPAALPPPFVPPAPPAPSAGTSSSAAPATPAYSGHGASTVPPEVLAKYAAPRLDPDVSRRIQVMLDVRAPGAGTVTSDGKRMFFTWTITGTRQIWRLDGPQRFPIEITGGEDPTTLADITPDGKYLVLSRDRKGEEYPGVYLLDPKGGPLSIIVHKPKVQAFYQFTSDDSRYIYYRANDVKPDSYAIYRYDLQSKERELVFGDDGIWSVADHQGTDKLLLVKEVGSNMEEYFEYAPAAKKLTPLFGQGERENHEAAYAAQPGEILVLTPKLGEYRRLYRWKEGKLAPITPDVNHDVSGFSIDHAKTRILYSVNEAGYTRPYALDAKTLQEIKLPKLPQADQIVYGPTSRDGRFTSLKIDTGVAPPESYVLTWATGQLVKWHSPSAPEVDTSKFVRASLEEYTARDGTKIPMFVRRPASCDKPCPVIVLFHGGPEGQATPGFYAGTQLFVDAGFTVLEPNVAR